MTAWDNIKFRFAVDWEWLRAPFQRGWKYNEDGSFKCWYFSIGPFEVEDANDPPEAVEWPASADDEAVWFPTKVY